MQLVAAIDAGMIELDPPPHRHSFLSPGWWKFFFMYVHPLSCFVPPLVLTWINPCLNPAPLLRYVSLNLWTVCFVMTETHWVMYSSVVKFCSSESKWATYAHSYALFSFMGGTLVWADFVAYSPLYYWYVFSMVAYLIAFVEYYATISLQHKRRICNLGGRIHEECNKKAISVVTYHTIFDTFSCLFWPLWVGFIGTSIGLCIQILQQSNRVAILDLGCLAIITPAPTSE